MQVASASKLLGSINDKESMSDNEACEIAQALWLEVSSTTHDKEEDFFSFVKCLELIKSCKKGLT